MPFGRIKGSQKLWELCGPGPLGYGAWLTPGSENTLRPTRVTTLNLLVLSQNVWSVRRKIRRKNCARRVQPFKSTQRYRNRHGLIGYL